MRLHTGLPVTVSYDAVAPSLRDAQDSSLAYLLGDVCAEELCDRYTSNTLTDADRALLAYVQPWLSWLAYSLWLRGSGTELGASGPQQPDGRTYNATTELVSAAGVATAQRRASYYRQEALDLLNDNITDYPCYRQRCGSDHPPLIVVR